MSYVLNCGDVMPGCPARLEDDDRDRLMDRVATHARRDHGVETITPELAAQVSGAIRRA